MFSRLHQAREKGFTLVELLVVVGIIGILAMLLLPQFRGMRDRARVASCQSNLKNTGTQLEVFFVDRDAYPTNAEWTAATPDPGSALSYGNLAGCSIKPAGALVTFNYFRDAYTPPASAGALATMPTADHASATGNYTAWCPQHNGSTPGVYPGAVQLFVSPDGAMTITP